MGLREFQFFFWLWISGARNYSTTKSVNVKAQKIPGKESPSKMAYDMENKLRADVFETDNNSSHEDPDPDIILDNPQSGCFGVCRLTDEGTNFVFYHESVVDAKGCVCSIRPKEGVLSRVQPLRMRLMAIPGICQMELRYAAIIIMKLFLGIKIRDPFLFGEFNAENDEQEQREGSQLKAAWIEKEGEPNQYVVQLEFEKPGELQSPM
ncbi:hypothetical protein M434DRAFT_38254 [Hypoxylon sp. CO27-5]|nr:hypothetical protein M434DRAFT_38254 [Hypoxylon sp. CO27-5]